MTETRSFSVRNPSTQYTLRVRNAGIASAVVILNGRQVLGPNAFNRNVALIDIPVALERDNALSVQLRSVLGSSIVVEIEGVDNDLPTISAIATPLANNYGWHRTPVQVSFACADTGSGVAFCQPPLEVAAEGMGQQIIGAAIDVVGNTAIASVTLNVDTTAPSVTSSFSPAPNAAGWNNSDVAVNFTCADTLSGVAECPVGQAVAGEGANQSISLTAIDLAGNSAASAVVVSIDKTPPLVQITSPLGGSSLVSSPVIVEGTVADSLSGVGAMTCNGEAAVVSRSIFTCTWALNGGMNSLSVTATDLAGNVRSVSVSVTLAPEPPPSGLPPDPATVAPPLPQTLAAPFSTSTEFLYTGTNPIQTGVAPGTIQPSRAAVLRGRVTTRESAPLAGVRVTIAGHAEFGATLSRADGMFDVAVNGGGPLTIDYEREGYLPSSRQVHVPWQDFVVAPDVALIRLDTEVTAIDLSPGPARVARGSVVTDADGTRRATLIFPEGGTLADMVLPDGTVVPAISELHVRATEYTVGANGQRSMPADLPATSGYTYAVDLSADEAIAAGATTIRFGRPISFYVENFIGLPVGALVPVGSYDSARGQWVGGPNGRVIGIVGSTGGLADVDITGDGAADSAQALNAIGIDNSERAQIADIYPVGSVLWRARISHFSPWDLNYPYGPADDAIPPPGEQPRDQELDNPQQNSCRGGSIILCESQALGEILPISGTPHALVYRSDRAPGRRDAFTVELTMSDSRPLPPSLARIDVTVTVGGRFFDASYSPAPNLRHAFTWDGKDAYGRTVAGAQPYVARVDYVYNVVRYQRPRTFEDSWGLLSGESFPGTTDRTVYRIPQVYRGTLGGVFDSRGLGLGGWTFSGHHQFDPLRGVLHLGSGERRTLSGPIIGSVISTVAGDPQNVDFDPTFAPVPANQARFDSPRGFATAPDGSLYFIVTQGENTSIRRLTPDGTVVHVAGSGTRGFAGDGGPASQALFNRPSTLALGPDGSLYVADSPFRVRRIRPDGIINTVAGTGFPCVDYTTSNCDDGHLATQARLDGAVRALAVDPDGSLYIAVPYRVRKVSTSGYITTVAGTGNTGVPGDGGPASKASIDPTSIAVGPQGSLYIATFGAIRRVDKNGIITRVAGIVPSSGLTAGDGGPALQAQFRSISNLTVAPDGSLYVSDSGCIRYIDTFGIINRFTGSCAGAFANACEDGRPAAATLCPSEKATLAPDGTLFLRSHLNLTVSRGVIRRASPLASARAAGGIVVPGDDGRELYVFTQNGRHVRTLNAWTHQSLREFAYDSQGHLATITEMTGGTNSIVTIEHDANGNPSAIVGAFAHRTVLTTDATGYLSNVMNPAGGVTQLVHESNGLMTQMTDAAGNAHRYAYDVGGRLIRDERPGGGAITLSRLTTINSSTVTVTSAEGRMTTYGIERLPTGDFRRVITGPGGAHTTSILQRNGTRTITTSDGTVETTVEGPDPRWGLLVPVTLSQTRRLPSGLTLTLNGARQATLADPADLFSLRTLTETVSVNGRTTTLAYNASTRTLVATTAAGRNVTTMLDALGRVTSQQAAGLAAVTTTYDIHGRVATVAQGPRTTTVGYDDDGLPSQVTDAEGRTTVLQRDAIGRITQQTRPDGGHLTYEYDAIGNLLSLTTPRRLSHSFTYTGVDLTSEYTPPAPGSSAATQYSYDLDDHLTRIARPDGGSIDFEYDAAGHVYQQTIPAGITRYSYEALTDRLTAIKSADATVGFTHDGPLPLSEAWTGSISGSVTRTYNSDFDLSGLMVNGITVPYSYDNDGLLTRAGALTITRGAASGLVTGTTIAATTTTNIYNAFGEATRLVAAHGGAALLDIQYTRDDLGRVIRQSEVVAGQSNTMDHLYDLAGRLIGVMRNGIATTYTYDDNDNRTSQGTVVATYDAQDRLLTYGVDAYSFTANGELAQKSGNSQTTSYTYDAVGNLTKAVLPSGTTVEYIADGRNRRIGKKVNGARVQGFLYQSDLRPVAELDATNRVVSRFVYGTRVNVPDYVSRGGATYRLITDYLGSPRLVVDAASGAIVQRMDYDAFGNVVGDTNPGFQPFGFAGGLYDPHTGLTRFGSRDYDAQTGRWTSKDPLRFAGGQANLYAYLAGDPINRTDPHGTGLLSSIAQAAVDAAQAVGRFLGLVGEPAAESLSNMAGGMDASLVQDPNQPADVSNAILSSTTPGFGTGSLGDTVGLLLDPTKVDPIDTATGLQQFGLGGESMLDKRMRRLGAECR